MKSEITELRNKLDKISVQFFKLLDDRKQIVKQIHINKVDANIATWDPKRELEIFNKYSIELLKFTQLELLSYSLIMESHASLANSSYPAWSKSIHLEADKIKHATSTDKWHMINPILVMICAEGQFKQLPLKAEFLTKILRHFDH